MVLAFFAAHCQLYPKIDLKDMRRIYKKDKNRSLEKSMELDGPLKPLGVNGLLSQRSLFLGGRSCVLRKVRFSDL
jgi:hypothetical protein